ncbi:general substrate transporter [Kalaharituber pfeilii]|nr:general substrate transporter [Kalaharituber pfeilii]
MGIFEFGQKLAKLRDVASGPVIIIGLTASMGGFMFGADTGQISGFLIMQDYLHRFAERDALGVYKFNDARAGAIVGIFSVGALLGSLASGPIGNRLGRRVGMIIGTIVFSAGTAIQLGAINKWYQIVVGRLITGTAIGILSVLVPMYISETVPKEVRGAMVAMYQLFVTLGIFLSYCINLGTSNLTDSASWRVPLGLSYLWAFILAIGMAILPESPRWLLAHDRCDDTLEALRFIAGKHRHNDKLIESQYQDIAATVQIERNLPKSTRGKILYRTLLGFCLQMLMQLTGANYFFYYGTNVFRSVGIENSYATQIILGAVNFMFTLPGMWAIERFGRRKPLIFGGLWQCAWLIIFGSVGSQFNPTDNRAAGAVMILSTCMFIIGFASTWGPGIWVATGEMYPLRVRAHCASFATAGNWFWNFMLTFFTPLITSSIGYRLGYIFAGLNLLGVVVVFFFCYESSNLTLEQVDMMYNDSNSKPWTSGKWVSPENSSRHKTAMDNFNEEVPAAEKLEHTEQHERISLENVNCPRETGLAAERGTMSNLSPGNQHAALKS